jgi:hypothetical protein
MWCPYDTKKNYIKIVLVITIFDGLSSLHLKSQKNAWILRQKHQICKESTNFYKYIFIPQLLRKIKWFIGEI